MASKGFRGRRKAGADAEIVGSPADGSERFADVVRGAPYDRRRAGDAPHEFKGEIVAAEVNPSRSHCHGDIRTIVDDDQRVGRRPASGQLDRQTDATDERRDGERFVAHLDHPHPGVEQALDEDAETACILPAIDEHTERDPRQAFARPIGGGLERLPGPRGPLRIAPLLEADCAFRPPGGGAALVAGGECHGGVVPPPQRPATVFSALPAALACSRLLPTLPPLPALPAPMAPIARSGRDLHPLPDTPLARAAVALAARQHRRPHPRPRVRRRARHGDPPYMGVD